MWEPRFDPWPGESLTIALSRPHPVEGRSTTIDAADLTISPGSRLSSSVLSLSVRTSVSTPLAITLPAGAEVRSLSVGGAARPIQLEDSARIRMRRHGNPDGVRLLVTHGNGFAADAYYPYWQHLLPKFDLLVFDFRNHGQNIPVEPSNHHYAQLSRDLERVAQEVRTRLGQKRTAGPQAGPPM